MYIIMYKYSAFRINHKSFRSSMSKNYTVIPGLLSRHPRSSSTSSPAPTGDLTRPAISFPDYFLRQPITTTKKRHRV